MILTDMYAVIEPHKSVLLKIHQNDSRGEMGQMGYFALSFHHIFIE